ncbi:MAG: hypothetical protein J5988_02575, partial [Eubacterium sp.]|nr:hypothetical protein [Eubacterium sp.]
MGLEKRKWQSCVTAAVFCILILGFTVATLIKPSTEFSETENRVLAQKPEAKPETVLSGEFEEKYEEYLTDQFILRNHWIGIKTAVERLLLKRESRDIYFADDDYLIEKHTGVFTTQMARRNITKLAEFTQLYAEQLGAGHVSVLIIPNAVDILEDKLPPFACAGSGNAYLKQISETLPEETWFDASQILQMHKNEELYYRTDHHWKTLAAFYVYQAWAGRQGYAVPELEDYEIKTVTDSFEGTIQSKLGIRTKGDTIELFFPENEFSYVVKKNNSSDN